MTNSSPATGAASAGRNGQHGDRRAERIYCGHAASLIPATAFSSDPVQAESRRAALASMTEHVVETTALVSRQLLPASMVPLVSEAREWAKSRKKANPVFLTTKATTVTAQQLDMALQQGIPPLLEDQVVSRVQALVVEREARRRLAAAAAGELPPLEWFDPDDTEAQAPHLIENVMKGGEGSSLLLVAQRKAGKSTLNDEMAYALASGAPFCGLLPTRLPDGAQVIVLDAEMSHTDITDTYRRCPPLVRSGRVRIVKAIGRASRLDLRTPEARQQLRHDLGEVPPGSVLIVDCLNPIFNAAGVKENEDQVGDIIDGLLTFAVELGASLATTHHMGKDEGQGARGHSSLEGKFGAVARLTYHGNDVPTASKPRYLEVFGRTGVGLDKTRITRDAEGHLVMEGATGAATAAATPTRSPELRTRDAVVFEMIARHPGETVTAIYDRLAGEGYTQSQIHDSLRYLAAQHRAVNLGNRSATAWVPQWTRDPMLNLDEAGVTPDTANGLGVAGSTFHEAAVRRRVAEICTLVARDEAMSVLTEAEMYAQLPKDGTPRSIHTAAYHRWEQEDKPTAAEDVPGIETPVWSGARNGVDVVSEAGRWA